MALVSSKNIAILMRKSLDSQRAVSHMKLQFKEKQVEKILIDYITHGNTGPYCQLLKILKEQPINDGNYKILLEDCLSCVLLFKPELQQFIDAVCNIEWASRNKKLVKLYYKFILDLITAHTYICSQIILSLVKFFKADVENWNDTPPEKLMQQWENIHTAIAHIVTVVPLATGILMQIVTDQFPYYKAGCTPNRAFIHNLIWISKYIPTLKEQIMTTIVNRLLLMDANMDRTKHKPQEEIVLEKELDKTVDVAQILDYCMLEMLKWLEEERDPVLNVLCTVFEKVIFQTYGIRHVQFLLLYTISINQQCADRILQKLWKLAAGSDGQGPSSFVSRRNAATHLAGLLARCMRVPNTRLIHYLRLMSDWCHSYITATQQSSTANENMEIHSPFHAICHAIFYLVAFKNHHLFKNKENLKFVESLNLTRLVTCKLNPLRTCAPQVCRAFASVTRSHQLLYCQALIEHNARLALPSAGTHMGNWFPYDPYTLPESGKIIWPLCVEYKDWLKEGEDTTQYSGMKRKMEGEEDDFLKLSPKRKLAGSLSNNSLPGFLTSDSIIMVEY